MTNHKSVLQTGTTDPVRSQRIGVTNDEAEALAGSAWGALRRALPAPGPCGT